MLKTVLKKAPRGRIWPFCQNANCRQTSSVATSSRSNSTNASATTQEEGIYSSLMDFPKEADVVIIGEFFFMRSAKKPVITSYSKRSNRRRASLRF